jgi:hypothetical protein
MATVSKSLRQVHSVEPREQKAAEEKNISEYKKASKTTA